MIRDLFSSCNIHYSVNKNNTHLHTRHILNPINVYIAIHIELLLSPVVRLFQLAMHIYAVESPPSDRSHFFQYWYDFPFPFVMF